MTSPRLSFAVGPRTATAPSQEVTDLTTASVKRNLGTGPEMQLVIPGASPAALLVDGLATDLWVYRNGILYDRHRILPVEQFWGESAEDVATIRAVGYRRLVEGRYIVSGPPSFTNVDQGSIIKQLIDHTQGQTGGSLGITFGTYTTGQLRTRTEYKIGDSIGTLTTALMNVENGCWWGVDADRVMTARLWSDFPTRTDPIVYGANARTMKRSPGPTSYANAAGAVGSALDTTPHWVKSATIATDPRGRWEVYDSSHGSTTLQATVNAYAQGLLDARAHPPAQWTIVLDPAAYFEGSSDYAEGELVQVVVPPTAVDPIGPPVNVQCRITEVVLGVDAAGSYTVTLAAVEVAEL